MIPARISREIAELLGIPLDDPDVEPEGNTWKREWDTTPRTPPAAVPD